MAGRHLRLMGHSIEIIGTESLGVRGLSCFIRAGTRRILIDPGVALGYMRHGLRPHPLQVAEGERIRRRIIKASTEATDIILSHFHGDHVPLKEANPYQLAIHHLPPGFRNVRCWSKSMDDPGEKMRQRALDLSALSGTNFHVAESLSEGPMTFSSAVPHGIKGSRQGTVMMTRIDLGEQVFVHASDIQLLDAETIELIIAWHPDIVLAAGPPLYLQRLPDELAGAAWQNALRLAARVDTLILDHHLMRDRQGPAWLAALSAKVGKQIWCAADFMGKKRLLLEASRTELYEKMAVPTHWHENYAAGLINLVQGVNHA
ncbi:MAG: hypothetical protein ABIJ50_10485 [Pseudomonadota bacterium]